MLFSLILGVIGLSMIVWRQKMAAAVLSRQRPVLKLFYKDLVNWESPWFLRIWTWALAIAGILLVVAAFAAYFGPIQL